MKIRLVRLCRIKPKRIKVVRVNVDGEFKRKNLSPKLKRALRRLRRLKGILD
jgi:hypothetical protein